MIIRKAILHIIDLTRGVAVPSNEEMDYTREDVREFIEKHVSRVLVDSNKREAVFNPDSEFRNIVNGYGRSEFQFIPFSQKVMDRVYQEMAKSSNLESMDLLVIEFVEEDVEYVVGFLWANQMAYTHKVINEASGAKNEIIRHFGIIPSTLQKIDSYFLINMSKNELEFVDKKRKIAGDNVMILPEKILQCDYKASSREILKTACTIAKEVAEEQGADITKTISKTKQFIAENAEEKNKLQPEEIWHAVAEGNEAMTKAFEEKAMEARLPKTVKVPQKYAAQKGGTHKIKTDTGIEITFPSSFASNTEYLRFINNSDGTISIEIVNVGEIIDR
ncbi:MAG: nucleoid-associated protein [Anaerovoracaceae bacterium]